MAEFSSVLRRKWKKEESEVVANPRQALSLAVPSLPESFSHFAIELNITVGTRIRMRYVKINTVGNCFIKCLFRGFLFLFGFNQEAIFLGAPGLTWPVSSHCHARDIRSHTGP